MNKKTIKIILLILNIGLVIGISVSLWTLISESNTTLVQNNQITTQNSSADVSLSSSRSILQSQSEVSERSDSSFTSIRQSSSITSSTSSVFSSFFTSSSNLLSSSSAISVTEQSLEGSGRDPSLIQKIQSRDNTNLVSVETFEFDNTTYRLLLKVNNDGSIANLAISQLDSSNVIDIESDLFRNFFLTSLVSTNQNGVFEIGIADSNGQKPNITTFTFDVSKYI